MSDDDMPISDLMTCQDAADVLGVTERTVWRYQDADWLPVIHVGRARFTSRAAVAELVEEFATANE